LAVLRDAIGDELTITVPLGLSSPHILSFRITGVNGRALLGAVRDELAFSLGSACATNKSEPSHVLLALGHEKRAITETVRVSFAADQTSADVEAAARMIASAAKDLRSFSPSA
jgi:cysteine desulfurase